MNCLSHVAASSKMMTSKNPWAKQTGEKPLTLFNQLFQLSPIIPLLCQVIEDNLPKLLWISNSRNNINWSFIFKNLDRIAKEDMKKASNAFKDADDKLTIMFKKCSSKFILFQSMNQYKCNIILHNLVKQRKKRFKRQHWTSYKPWMSVAVASYHPHPLP
jgi:hypothetical protein